MSLLPLYAVAAVNGGGYFFVLENRKRQTSRSAFQGECIKTENTGKIKRCNNSYQNVASLLTLHISVIFSVTLESFLFF